MEDTDLYDFRKVKHDKLEFTENYSFDKIYRKTKFINTFRTKEKDTIKPKKFLSADKYPSETFVLGTIIPIEKLPLHVYISLQFTKRTVTDYVNHVNAHVLTFQKINELYYRKKKNKNMSYYYSIIQKQEWIVFIMKTMTALRRFAQIWLYKKYKSNQLNTEDPATLSIPSKPIHVYDSKAKGTYIFEASTIKKQFISDISYCDWLIPSVRHPKNPFTNLPFSFGQKIKIINDLKTYNIINWYIEAYKNHSFNIDKFQEELYIPIRLKGLDDLINNTSSEQFISLICEFIEDQYDYHNIYNKSILNLIYWGINKLPDDLYIKKWINIFYKFYRQEIINSKENDYIDLYRLETKILFGETTEILRINKLRLNSIPIRLNSL
jgi:hypothetical protein